MAEVVADVLMITESTIMLAEAMSTKLNNSELYANLEERLSRFDQTHLLRFWNELSDTERVGLAEQIHSLDLAALRGLTQHKESFPLDLSRIHIQPPNAITLDSCSQEAIRAARTTGEATLRQGKVAMVLVAGGQGTRLGFDHPKGMYPIAPISGRTLFQIHIDRLKALMDRFQVSIPLYLMTSPATDAETRAYFDAHHRFGLLEEDLRIICQGVMPAIDRQSGRILMESRSQLALSPDGHGGLLAAMQQHGCLEHARNRGIEILFYGQVDNPLLPICDPALIGFHLSARSEMTTQVVRKRFAKEKVGNVVSIDGRTQIIEYSDLPDSLAELTNPDGSLTLWAGNIAVHIFDLSFVERNTNQVDALPFHRAIKKVPYVDDSGSLVQPSEPNAIKFERFIFDLLPLASNAMVVEAKAHEVFAPVKNAPGDPIDSPDTARRAMIRLHQSWLRSAGVTVHDETAVEIHPGWALDESEAVKKIQPGISIEKSTYFS